MKKNTLNLIVFNLINSSAQFIIVMILSRYFTKVDYATYSQVFLPFEVLAPLIGLGLSSSIFYFYPRYENKKKLLINCLSILLLMSVLFELFLLFGLGKLIATHFNNQGLNNFLFYTGIFSFFSLANTVLYSYLILEDKTKLNIYTNFSSNSLQIILLLCIVNFYNNIENVILMRVIIYALSFAIMITAIKLRLKINFDELKNGCVEIIKYSFPLAFSMMVGVVSYQLGKVIVSTFCDNFQYAIYINGAFEIPLIAIVTSSLAGASFGIFTNLCKEGDYDNANILFKKITTISALLIFPAFIFLFFFAKKFVVLAFGQPYIESYKVFRIFLLLLPIRIIQYGNILIALGKSKVLMKRSVIELLLNVLVSILLFQYYGYVGVAIGSVVSILFWTVPFNLKIIADGFGMSLSSIIPTKKLILILVCCFISVFLVFIIDFFVANIENLILFFGIFGLLYGICYLILIYVFKIISFDPTTKLKIKLN